MERTSASPRMVRVLSAILLVATFAGGVVTGAGLHVWTRWPRSAPPPPMPGPLPIEQLGLNEEQRKAAHEILERHRPELDAVLRETFPRFREINDRMAEELKAVLTPEQRLQLDELRSRRHPLPPPPHRRSPGQRPDPGDWGRPGPPPPFEAPSGSAATPEDVHP